MMPLFSHCFSGPGSSPVGGKSRQSPIEKSGRKAGAATVGCNGPSPPEAPNQRLECWEGRSSAPGIVRG
jgi:hypothetical protein